MLIDKCVDKSKSDKLFRHNMNNEIFCLKNYLVKACKRELRKYDGLWKKNAHNSIINKNITN